MFFIFDKGFIGGLFYGYKGVVGEFLCLLRNLEWGIYIDGYDGSKVYVYGVEYEIYMFKDYIKFFYDYDILCVVCFVS